MSVPFHFLLVLVFSILALLVLCGIAEMIKIIAENIAENRKMKYTQLILMGLTLALSPIACFANDWFIAGVFCNLIVIMAAVYLTFEDTISKQPEARLLSIMAWGSLAFQVSYSFFL